MSNEHWTHPDPAVRELIEHHINRVLAELTERCERSEATLLLMAEEAPMRSEERRLRGKREGIALVRDYIRGHTFPGPVSETGPAQTTGAES
jgi:hypothetical protein